MKKKLSVLFLITIILSALSICANASEYRSEVSVGLKYGKSAGKSVKLSSASGLTVYDAAVGTVLYTAAPNEELNIEMGSTGFASWNKFSADGIAKVSVQPAPSTTIWCDGKEYRGYIYLERRTNGELIVKNFLGTDEYVASVLGKEMSYTWPLEALKAQAVCARNFVLTRGSAHKDYGFDVCTTVHCQVYGGVASEHENTRRAVNETKGVLAKYNGKIVSLYFFATSGGQTEDVENVWGSPYGYLKSVPDTYENPQKASRYTWTTKFTKEEIASKLKSAGYNIGAITNIEINSVTDSGRVTEMTFYGTSGKQSFKREKCRTILGLYSQKFTIVPNGGEVNVSTTNGNAKAPLYAQTASGVSGVAGFTALSGNGTVNQINVGGSGADSYTINGGGYGHGVGMSQWGARGMAENGFTYDQILKHYFTDIVLE